MKLQVLLTLCILCSGAIYAQSTNAVTGKWLNEEKDGKIEIYEQAGKYFGKLVWMKEPYEADGKTLKKDIKNKDAQLRSRPLLNAVIMRNFVYDDGEWTDGEIYDPRSGKTYSCEMKLNNGKLEVRGYIGSPVFGKTAVFTRV